MKNIKLLGGKLMEELLLPVERLSRFLRHESPVVRKWAWQRFQDIHPREIEIPLAALKEERDALVLQRALHFFREVKELPSEVKEELKEFLLSRLEIEENKKLMVSMLSLLSRLTSLKTLLKEHPHLLEKIRQDEIAVVDLWNRVISNLPPEEMPSFRELWDRELWEVPAWEAFYAGYRVWTTADPAPIKEIYPRLREYLSNFLEGLPVLPSDAEYFLEILPEEVRDWWEDLSRESARKRLRAFVEEEFRKLREKVIGLRGEIALRHHLERPRSLGPVFKSLEVLLEISRGDTSEPVVLTLGRLLLTLLWGNTLLGLPENLPRETIYELYFDENRPSFPEDSILREKILGFMREDPSVVEEVRERLRKVFSRHSYGAERGVELAREWGETFLEELLELYRTSLKEDFGEIEYIEEPLKDFIHLNKVREELRKLAREHGFIHILYLLAHYPDRTTAEELAENFEFWLEEDHDALASVLLAFPHPEIWKKMKKQVHPETPSWPKTFVILAHLFEPDFPGLNSLEKRVIESDLRLWNTLSGLEEPDFSKIELTLGLKCKTCNYLFPFSPKVVMIFEETREVDLPEKVHCPRCGAEDLFEIPEMEKMRVVAKVLLHQEEGDEWDKNLCKKPGSCYGPGETVSQLSGSAGLLSGSAGTESRKSRTSQRVSPSASERTEV